MLLIYSYIWYQFHRHSNKSGFGPVGPMHGPENQVDPGSHLSRRCLALQANLKIFTIIFLIVVNKVLVANAFFLLILDHLILGGNVGAKIYS